MRAFSAGALHERLDNLLYVRAAVEELPSELLGAADRLSVVLPWGSLLAAVARPSSAVLHRIRGLCQPGAVLTIVLGVDPVRDQAELGRLGLESLLDTPLAGRLAEGYAAAGFRLESAGPVAQDGLAGWSSTWLRRLVHGRERKLFRVAARATSLELEK